MRPLSIISTIVVSPEVAYTEETSTQTLERDLVIVGGGHAVLELIKQASRWTTEGFSISLISDSPYLYYSGMVPEYLGDIYTKQDVHVDLQALATSSGVEYVKARVTSIDTENRTVTTRDGRVYHCRVAVFDIGTTTPGMPEGKHISPSKPLHKIEALHSFIDELLYGPRQDKRRNLVIVGGGAAGVEIALNISARMKAEQHHTHLGITLVEEDDRLLGRFPASMADYVSDLLQQRGVDVRIRRKARQINDHQLILDDQHEVPYDFMLWATGISGQTLFRDSGLKCDRRHFLHVEDTLQYPEHPWLLAGGDCAHIHSYPDLMKIAVHAISMSGVILNNVDVLLRSEEPRTDLSGLKTFHPKKVAPLLLSTGDKEGLWAMRDFWLHSKTTLRIKHLLDRRWIEQYQYPFQSRSGFIGKWKADCAMNQD